MTPSAGVWSKLPHMRTGVDPFTSHPFTSHDPPLLSTSHFAKPLPV